MSLDEIKQLCRKSWEEGYNYLSLEDLKREIKEDTVFVMKVKTYLLNILRKRNLCD